MAHSTRDELGDSVTPSVKWPLIWGSHMSYRLVCMRRATSLFATATLVSSAAVATAAVVAVPSAGADAPSGCQLGNGVKHVISIVFDNVHFFRDNPNVPSDLEQMPHLLNFLEGNGTVFSNTPHAADRAHRRRQPDDLHRALRRPARPAADQHLQDLQPERLYRPCDVVRLLDEPGRRHGCLARRQATTRRRR